MKPAFAPVSAGPVSVAARSYRLRGKTHLTIVVKVACRMVQDLPMEVTNPTPIVPADVLRSAAPVASVVRPNDLALLVRHPQIMLDAVAFASAVNAREVEQMKVRLAVARGTTMVLSKELIVVGDRTTVTGRPPGRPLPFAQMPIIYERAPGGPAMQENPVGVGTVTEGGGRVTLPNVVPGEGVATQPVGFAPISSAWPERRARLGGVAPAEVNASSFVDLPEAFDGTYFQAAPRDQWLESIKSGDLLVFIGLHPDMPTLRTSIPNVRGVAMVETTRGNKAPVRLRLDTIFAEPHLLKAELTFRGSIEVLAEDLDGILVGGALEDPAHPFVFPDLKTLTEQRRLSPQIEAPIRQGRDSTLLIEPEAPGGRLGYGSTRDAPIGAGLGEAPPRVAVKPAGSPALSSTMVIEVEAPPKTQAPSIRRRDLTVEMSLEEAPRSLPFARKSKRGRSSGSMRAATDPSVEKAGTPWAREAPARAPAAKEAIDSTLVVDVPPPALATAPAVAPAPPPPPAERKKVQWAHVEPAPEAAKPAPAPPRPVVQPAPDRKADLYKKFKR